MATSFISAVCRSRGTLTDQAPSKRKTVLGNVAMNDDLKKDALDTWYKILNEPQLRMDCEEQYDELLKAADEMERTGLINSAQWRELVRQAGTAFSNAIESVDGGT